MEENKFKWLEDTNKIIQEITTASITDDAGNTEQGIVFITEVGDMVLSKTELELIVMMLEEE